MNEHNNYANTSKIEEYLHGILRGTVSDIVFAGTLPSALESSWNDMVLIDCDLPVDDYGPYSKATVYIFLYARPNADGTKNVVRLAQMEESLNNVLDSVSNDHYRITRQSNGSDYDSDINWHRNYVNLNLIVVN